MWRPDSYIADILCDIVAESIRTYLNEDDIVRYEDVYNREAGNDGWMTDDILSDETTCQP